MEAEMERMKTADLLEAVEMYEDIIEKQSNVIVQLSKLVKKQSMELANLRNVNMEEEKESQI